MKASEIIKHIKETTKDIEFLPTGYNKLDTFLDGGFMRKELIVLGGYTGLGKSFVAGSFFFNIASKGFNSAYFSLEISNAMIVSRLIGSLANIKPTRIINGLLTKEEYDERIDAEVEVTSQDSLMTFYDSYYDFEEIKKVIQEEKFEFIVIDFVQNIIAKGFREEYERLSYIASKLQKLAKETNSCVLLLSQLSNQAARSGLLEYKGSGSIQTVCDLGFFIERADPMQNLDNLVKLILRKNRRGISGQEFEFVFKQPGGKLYEF